MYPKIPLDTMSYKIKEQSYLSGRLVGTTLVGAYKTPKKNARFKLIYTAGLPRNLKRAVVWSKS